MEMEIFDAQFVAGAVEGCADGFVMVRKYSTDTPCHNPLLKKHFPRVIAREIEHGYALMIAILLPWIFAIPDDNDAVLGIHIVPGDLGDLLQPHGRCNRKSNDPVHRDELARLLL